MSEWDTLMPATMTEHGSDQPETTANPNLNTAVPASGSELGIAGVVCPECGRGIIDYDGLLNLVCPVCKFTQGGCFT